MTKLWRGCTGGAEAGVPEGHEHHIRKCWWGDVQNVFGCSGAAREAGGHWHGVPVWCWLATDCAEGRPRDAVGQISLPQWLLSPCVCLLVQKAPEPADSSHDARAAQSEHGYLTFQVPANYCALHAIGPYAVSACQQLFRLKLRLGLLQDNCAVRPIKYSLRSMPLYAPDCYVLAASAPCVLCCCAEALKQHKVLSSTYSLGAALAKHTCR